MKKFLSFGNGLNTVLLFSIGLAAYLVWRHSRKNQTTSPELKLIQDRLIAAGLTPQAARMWAAVSQFETGNFTSSLSENAKNLFGMKRPRARETTAIGETNSGFAIFDSLTDSVDDLVLYMREFSYPTHFDSADSLVSFMKSKGYFEEPLSFYLQGIKSFLS